MYNDLREIYFDEYYDLLVAKRNKMDRKYDPIELTFGAYDHSPLFEKEDSDDTTLENKK